MDLKDVIAPISGLFGVLIGGAITVWKESRAQKVKDKKALEYLAVMVVFALDKYANEAVAVVMDHGEPDADDEHHSRQAVAPLPIFKPEDIKVEWSVLPSELTYEVFNLAPRTAHAMGAIDFEADQAGPPDYEEVFEERQVQFAELGLAAASLADELRRLAKLPAYKQRGNWNPVAVMQEKQKELHERRTKRARRERLNPDM